jgi:hypothetical protein
MGDVEEMTRILGSVEEMLGMLSNVKKTSRDIFFGNR